MTYTVIGHPQSRAMRVMWMLEEAGQAYDIVPAAPQSDEARAANGTGKVPSLKVSDQVLTDSVAICQFIADHHSVATFSAGTVLRGIQDGHTQFICDEIDGSLWSNAKHRFALPEAYRIDAVRETARFEFTTAMTRLEKRLGDGPYLMGDTFTVADVIAAHCLSWAKSAGFDVHSDAVTAYGKACRARPAFRRALERAVPYSKK